MRPSTPSAALIPSGSEAKAWLRQLPRQEAVQLAADVGRGAERGKGRPVQPLLPALPEASRDEQERPYAHPYYWAAFVLIGESNP